MNPIVRTEVLEERTYQSNMAREAIRRNTLVVLPTALGKTVIAILVASHFLYNYSNMKVLVMAPTRPLVLQHRDTFMRFLKLRPQDAQVLTGRLDPEYRLHAWRGPFRIYFATPQVVRNDHELGMSLRDFSLLVFDECHRARKNYAYTRVAQAYVNESPHPIILALTASPGADKERIHEICRALYIEHLETRTEEDPDVKPYISPVAVDWKFVSLPPSYGTVSEILRRMLESRLRRLSSMGVIRKNPRYIFRTDLLKAGDEIRYRIEESPSAEQRGRLFGALVLQSSALTLYHALELLESQGVQTLKCFLDRIRLSDRASHRSVVSELTAAGVYDALNSGSLGDHPKVVVLERILREQLSLNPSSRIIVFTQYRDTSSYLVSRLSKLGIPSARFIGQGDRGADPGLTQEDQARLLEKFREGEIRALVATSIGEEGLDIPSVDLVVFYEPVPSEIRYIQRKGRTGRRSFGRVVILAAEGTLDVRYLAVSRKMAEKMKRIVNELNMELNPIIRSSPPSISPIPMEVISEMDKLPQPPAGIPAQKQVIEREGEEKERLRIFNREVREVSKRILGLALKSGNEGAQSDELIARLEDEGIGPAVAKAAIRKLTAEGQIRSVNGRIFPVGAILAEPSAADVHIFEVERVLPGGAILLVDDKWRASLAAGDYNGPRQLIKKGIRFRAIAKFYRQNGKFHVRIHAIQSTSA